MHFSVCRLEDISGVVHPFSAWTERDVLQLFLLTKIRIYGPIHPVPPLHVWDRSLTNAYLT